jgi:hypothetical protein
VAYEIAKLMLERGGSLFEREEAVRVAVYLGMPLEQVEEYLDWLECVPPTCPVNEPRPIRAVGH